MLWLDEPAHYDFIDDVWDNALFGMRLGNPSHVVATTTPKPTKWMKEVMADPRTIISRASTYANLANLDPAYRELVIEKYEGTRLGLQELHGELLEDVEGSLWTSDMIVIAETLPEHFERIIVSVDPAGTADKRSDETGIIVLGWAEKKMWVLEDLTGHFSPKGWGDKAWGAHERWGADLIVAEKNYGGDMVRHVLDTSSGNMARVKLVNSRRGKSIRAEPIVAQYEKDNVRHGPGLGALEGEQLTWVPGEGASPNRVDALVHGGTELFRGFRPGAVSNPSQVLRHLKVRGHPDPMQRRTPYA